MVTSRHRCESTGRYTPDTGSGVTSSIGTVLMMDALGYNVRCADAQSISTGFRDLRDPTRRTPDSGELPAHARCPPEVRHAGAPPVPHADPSAAGDRTGHPGLPVGADRVVARTGG